MIMPYGLFYALEISFNARSYGFFFFVKLSWKFLQGDGSVCIMTTLLVLNALKCLKSSTVSGATNKMRWIDWDFIDVCIYLHVFFF